MVTIAASRVWALNMLRRLLWTSHAPIAGGWPSRGCGPGSASCKGAGYLCLCRDLGFPLVATRGALLRAVAGLVLQWQWGIPLQKVQGLLLPPALRYQWSCLGNRPAPPMEGGYRLYPLAPPPDDRMSIATSEGESDQSGDDGSVALPPSGRSAVPDSEMVAMLARAAESVGLEWRPPPCPEPSRMDDWFLGVARAGSQGPTPVPFFPEVHDELTGTWTAPFTARNRSSGSSSLATLDGGAAQGYMEVPPVERSVAMQLCPRTASKWRCNPLLPSRACRHSSALTGSAYATCEEAASALHAMVLLQVHQAKALRDLHEGGHDPGVLSELRTVTDLALRATKVTARSLGRAMFTMVVQERHLWLCLADMKEADKARFLNAPVSQTGLFGDAVENFAQDGFALREMVNAPLPPPEEDRAENPLFLFFFAQNLNKRAVSSISGSPEGTEGCERVKLESHSPSSLASEQLWAVREGGQSHYSRTLCRNAGKCVTHADPTSDRQRDDRAGSLRSPSLPHRGYVGRQTRLCDSVRPATSQVSRHPLHRSEAADAPILQAEIAVLLAKDAIEPVPPVDMRSGFYSPYFIVPKKGGGLRPILDLRVLNRALHRLPFKMLTPKRIFGCVRPQDWFAAIDLKDAYFHLPRHRPFLRFAFEGRAYQYKVLPLGLSLSPRVFMKVAEAALVPLREQGVRILNYLDDWLILAQSRDQLCELGALAPQPVGPSGQLGKEQTLPGAEDLFSRYGVGLCQSDSAPHAGTRSVGVELLEYIQEQDGGTTETVSEAPGAYGGCGSSHAAGAAPYETASTLAPWPSPEVGMAERHAAGPSHSSLPPNLHPVVRPFIPSGRSAPGTGLQARCGLHRCLRQGLGGHGQRACFVGGLDGSPTALAHQLPRVSGSTPGLEPSQETLTRQACTGPYGQHYDRCVHQPTRWSTLPSHVTTRPSLPPLESEASEVASRHSYPGLAQPDSRRAVMSCALRRVETPSPDSPADLDGSQCVRFGLAQVDLFASLETSHCQLFYSLTEETLGMDAMAHSWPWGLRKYAFPPVNLLAQTLCKVREEEEQILLVAPYWPTRTWFPELMLLVTAPPWQIPLRKDLLTQRQGTLWHPRPDLWKLHVWSLDRTRRS